MPRDDKVTQRPPVHTASLSTPMRIEFVCHKRLPYILSIDKIGIISRGPTLADGSVMCFKGYYR